MEAVNSTVGATLVVCPKTLFNLTNFQQKGQAPLILRSSILSLQCGSDGSRSNECVFEGGQSQITLEEKRSQVSIQGMTFRGATKVAVVVKGTPPFLVEFSDCAFENAIGTSAIQVSSSNLQPLPAVTDDVLASNTLTRFRDLAQASASLSSVVGIRDCTFTDNHVKGSLVENYGASVDVELSQFTGNVVGQSVVSNANGTLSLTSSCFSRNAYNSAAGLISGSSVASADNFAKNNTSGCEGVVQADGTCAGFNSASCTASQTLSPSASPQSLLDCYSDWEKLFYAVEQIADSTVPVVLKLCPNTTFDLDKYDNQKIAPIVISSDVTVQCGSSGKATDNCLVSGSSSHFRISGNTSTVQFRGLKLERASKASILATGGPSAQLTVSDCEFQVSRHHELSTLQQLLCLTNCRQNNSGFAVVFVDQKATDVSLFETEGFASSHATAAEPSMSVTFTGCLFTVSANKRQISTYCHCDGLTHVIFLTMA